MSEKIRVVFCTTEIVPFSKVGGLADVMGALPDSLEQLGCEVTIITPLYASIDRKAFTFRLIDNLIRTRFVNLFQTNQRSFHL